MDRLAVARILRKIGRLLEVQGASPVKARAYEREARARWAGDLERVIAEDLSFAKTPSGGPQVDLSALIRRHCPP